MTVRIITADVVDGLAQLPDGSVHCCVTSPPYFGLRDYGMPGQIGLEATPAAFVARLVDVFRDVRRVLRDDGTCWLNMGDSYASSAGVQQPHRNSNGGFGGSDGDRTQAYARSGGGFLRPSSVGGGTKTKDLLLIPERLAIALCDDGWYIRARIIWHKPNPMPESVTDRPTKSHEHIWLMSKQPRYFYDAEAIKEPAVTDGRPLSSWNDRKAVEPIRRGDPGLSLSGHANGTGTLASEAGRNARDVWTIATSPFAEAHFATFPPELAERCIKAGCPAGGTVLDCFGGAGTTGLVADRLQRNAILIELNPDYAAMAEKRLTGDAPLFAEVSR